MNKIPTAEEFLKELSPNDKFGLRADLGHNAKHIYEIMNRFAKLHVKAALEAASEKTNYPYRDEFGCHCDVPNIVLNAYPLDSIN